MQSSQPIKSSPQLSQSSTPTPMKPMKKLGIDYIDDRF